VIVGAQLTNLGDHEIHAVPWSPSPGWSLQTHGAHIASGARGMSDRWSTSRVEAFSDAALAIAITVLVLEISVPESAFDNLWKGIADQWPAYLAYATSLTTRTAMNPSMNSTVEAKVLLRGDQRPGERLWRGVAGQQAGRGMSAGGSRRRRSSTGHTATSPTTSSSACIRTKRSRS